MRQIGIVGSGPAGLTAAIYAARGGLTSLVVTGQPAGGALMTTTDVENFPGFVDGISGPELVDNMRRQAERLGAQMVDGHVQTVDFKCAPFKLTTGTETLTVDAVILAVGSVTRWLGLPSEERLRGRGVSACATCDGYFFKQKDVVVVGGGDNAMEEALFLSQLGATVTVLMRAEKPRASFRMVERLATRPNIRLMAGVRVQDILGDDVVTGVRVTHIDGTSEVISCSAAFVAIGSTPSTTFLKGQITLDDAGYIKLYNCTGTSVPGVFAAGDAYDHRYKQAITAAASGCKAALDCIRYLEAGELGGACT